MNREITMSVRLTEDDRAYLRKFARSQERTMSAQIRLWIARSRREAEEGEEP